jgi:hypothetical protein
VTNRPELSPAHRFLIACAFVGLFSTVAGAGTTSETARDSSAVSDSIVIENNGSAVEIDGKPILLIYAPIAGFTPSDRAIAIQQRIIGLSRNTNMAIEAIHAEDRGTWTEILAGSNRIMGITEGDAKAAERPRVELAEEYTEVLRLVVKQYREGIGHLAPLLAGNLYAALASVCLVVLLVILFFIRRSAGSRIERWLARRETEGATVPVALRLKRYLGPPFTALFRTLFWIIALVLLQSYLAVVLRFFPSTRYTSYRITNLLLEFAAFGRLPGYIPNLLLILCLASPPPTSSKSTIISLQEISNQRVTIRGFTPTGRSPQRLIRTLIPAATAIAFPLSLLIRKPCV